MTMQSLDFDAFPIEIVDFGLFIASILFTLSTPGLGARRVLLRLFGLY